MTTISKVLNFPRTATMVRAHGVPAWTALLLGRLIEMLCRSLNQLQIVRAVKDVSVVAPFSRQHVSVHIGALFTCISVNGQDNFYRRF